MRQSSKSVYDVDVLGSPVGEGALFVGVTHLRAGNVGDEFFMTRGHFHQRREQGEVYFGLRGCGLLLLQTEAGDARQAGDGWLRAYYSSFYSASFD